MAPRTNTKKKTSNTSNKGRKSNNLSNNSYEVETENNFPTAESSRPKRSRNLSEGVLPMGKNMRLPGIQTKVPNKPPELRKIGRTIRS